MAISMSGAKVETGERDSLRSSYVNQLASLNGVELNRAGWFGMGETTGKELAGITASFASHVSTAIDEYCEEIDTQIEELSKVEVNMAFKGAGLESALNEFIESVKSVAKSYTKKLKAAEAEIVNSVAKAYETQDSDLSSNLNSDGSTLESNSVS